MIKYNGLSYNKMETSITYYYAKVIRNKKEIIKLAKQIITHFYT